MLRPKRIPVYKIKIGRLRIDEIAAKVIYAEQTPLISWYIHIPRVKLPETFPY